MSHRNSGARLLFHLNLPNESGKVAPYESPVTTLADLFNEEKEKVFFSQFFFSRRKRNCFSPRGRVLLQLNDRTSDLTHGPDAMFKIHAALFIKLIIRAVETVELAMAARKKPKGLWARQSSSLALPVMSLADAESLTMPLVQVIVLTADLGCVDCQSRVGHVFSKLDAATGSMLVDASEKKVTLISRVTAGKGPRRRVASFQSYCSPRKLVKKIFTFF